jgi:hypothetical protein
MLDQYIQKSKYDPTCLSKPEGQEFCPVEMDVSYIKKSKDKQYKLVYHLTNDNLAYFTDEAVKDGSLKNFI